MSDSRVLFTEESQVDDLLEYAQKEVQKVKSGEMFMVKDLFRGYEWNRIKMGTRTRLGSEFYRFANGLGKDQIKPEKKSPQHQQIYKKI